MTIKLEDLTIEELINLYSFVKRGRQIKEVSLNEFEGLKTTILDEISRRNKQW